MTFFFYHTVFYYWVLTILQITLSIHHFPPHIASSASRNMITAANNSLIQFWQSGRQIPAGPSLCHPLHLYTDFTFHSFCKIKVEAKLIQQSPKRYLCSTLTLPPMCLFPCHNKTRFQNSIEPEYVLGFTVHRHG